MITRKDVEKLAELALIAVPDKEIDKLAGEMDSILGYVSEVTKLAEEEAGEREKPLLRNVMREDVVTNQPGTYTEKILSEAPQRDGNYLRVKKIL
jgi:aspartyl-tRNA(Asn)/glutamyl-tRNA(Gln) amidotransferase subunit C